MAIGGYQKQQNLFSDRGTASKFAALQQRSRVLSLYRFSVALCPVAPPTIYCTEPVNLKTGAQDRTGYMK